MVKRIRAARHYQPNNDPSLRLSRSAMMGIARELKSAFDNLGSMVPHDKVVALLKQGKHPQSVINWHHYTEVLKGVFARIGKLRASGGELGAKKINGTFHARGRKVRYRKSDKPLEYSKATKSQANYRRGSVRERCGICTMFLPSRECTAVFGDIDPSDTCDFFAEPVVAKAAGDFTFDSFSPDVQAQVRRAQDVFIQQLETDARDTIETIIHDGMLYGTPLDEIASNIKDMIGLTDTQAQAVLNYQNMLQTLDPGALQRQLRNTDYDAAVEDAMDAGSDLSQTAIANMVADYVDNYLTYRAATIAQTESTRAAALGLHDAYKQAIDRGALTDESVTRQWLLGDSPCPICESIVDNNPDGVAVGEDFDSDDGPVSDPPVHPNCECSVDYVTDLSKVPE